MLRNISKRLLRKFVNINWIIALVISLCFPFLAPTPAEAQEKKKGIPMGRKPKVNAMVKKARGFEITNDYVHKWIKFPVAKGKSIKGGMSTIKSVKGFVSVIYFVASWDVKSQEILAKLKKVENKYAHQNAKFYYIFTHDTYEDATAFAKEYGIENGLIAGHEINKAFHHPNVPSIYVGDRHGWLSTRFLAIDSKEVDDLDNYLRLLTAI